MTGFFWGLCVLDLINIKYGVAGREYLSPDGVDFVELATVQRPGEDRQDGEHREHGHRHQQVEHIHGVDFQRRSRSALQTTNSELVAMPRPAAHGGKKPVSASGTQTAL